MSFEIPSCPIACSSVLQNVDFDYCDPNVLFGEIDHIYVASYEKTAFLDWTSLTEWNTYFALAAIDPIADTDAIIDLNVIGDYPPAESEEIEISLGRKIQTPATFIINFEIDDLSDYNYENFMRWFECNFQVRIWFSANEVLFGSSSGIPASIMAKYQIERGQKSIHKIIGTVKWEEAFSPERITNPMA